MGLQHLLCDSFWNKCWRFASSLKMYLELLKSFWLSATLLSSQWPSSLFLRNLRHPFPNFYITWFLVPLWSSFSLLIISAWFQGSCSHGVWGMQRFSTCSGSSTQEHHPLPAQRTEVQIAEPNCRVRAAGQGGSGVLKTQMKSREHCLKIVAKREAVIRWKSKEERWWIRESGDMLIYCCEP